MSDFGTNDQGKDQHGDLQTRAIPIIQGLLTQIRSQQGWIQNYKEDLPQETKILMKKAEDYIRENRTLRSTLQVSGEEPEQVS